MHTSKGSDRGHFWISAAALGVVVMIIAAVIFFKSDRNQAEEALLKTVNYIRVQCATYTYYNKGSETQALLRGIESCNQVQEDLSRFKENGDQPDGGLLEGYARRLWLSGIILLDSDGSQVCSYADDERVQERVLGSFSRETVLAGDGYPNRHYAQRIYLDDNSYINLAATARKDTAGMIVTYYYIPPESAYMYSLTIQNLMEGYSTSSDGTFTVAKDGYVIASNDAGLLGQSTTDNVTIQTLQESGDSRYITYIPGDHSYGVMTQQRNYYICGRVAAKNVFKMLPQKLLSVMLVYGCVATVIWLLLRRGEIEHQEYEARKETEYREQLLAAAQRADAANMAKTMFLQRMSHDIRTPINGICGMLEVADYYADDLDRQAECRSKIRDASHLLLELVNEVLDMGKLESGEVVMDEQPFDLRAVLEEVLVVIEKLSQERDITLIREEYQVRHWQLVGSAVHVKRIYMNILNNAVKYNKEHGTITIGCRELTDAGEGRALIEFTCADTGIGMSTQYQEKIFEPFTQENSSNVSKYGGTGLGMSIVKGLVDRLDGTITFDSREGVGTTFVVTIPFKIDTESDAAANSAETLCWIGGDAAGAASETGGGTSAAVRGTGSGGAGEQIAGIAQPERGEHSAGLAKEHTAGGDAQTQQQMQCQETAQTRSRVRAYTDSSEPSLGGYHILLAEDNELNMEIAQFVLERAGAVVRVAWNGREAAEIFGQSKPGEFDAILMDLLMPVADGYEATAAIRAMDRTDAAAVPIIAMTANAFTEDRLRTREAGMNGHIAKPIDARQVVETIYMLVRARRDREDGV